ncbi:MAG: hypothetical protein ACRELV_13745 [Longimicrobiales bacterium]
MSTARIGRVSWGAAVWSGIIAGAVFVVLEMGMVQLFLGESMWGPPRMIAAIVMGGEVLPPPGTFDLGIFITGAVVHFVLSVVFAIVLALVISRVNTGAAVAVGGLYGLALYGFNFYVMTGVFPWFAMARNWVSVLSHLVFGLVAAWVYKRMQKPSRAQAA